MKEFIKKNFPLVFAKLKALRPKPKILLPKWNTLTYEPMKGVKMFFAPTGAWQKKYLNNSYDKFFFNRLKKMNLRGKTIYDIGAHIGFHSFYFARLVGPGGKVYSFEPHPKNVERFSLILGQNKDLQSIVSIFDIAISNKEGVEEFNLNNDIESGRSSGGFIDSADTIWDRAAFTNKGFVKTIVQTLPLDIAITKLNIKIGPDIIKIDVEGAESLVLEGSRKIIEKYHPLILVETHSAQNKIDVEYFLSSIGYELEILNKETDGRYFIEAKPKS